MNLKPIFNLRKITWTLLGVVVPALLFYGIAIWVLRKNKYSLNVILSDMAQTADISSFMGFVSTIGVWLWVSAVAVCCYSFVLNRPLKFTGRGELLTILTLLTALLAVDDFFLLHERYVYQKGIFLFYAICALTLFVRHFRRIIEIDGFAFILSGSLLALSVIIDIKQRKIPMDYNHLQVIEEGCKFVGGALWLYFCARVGATRDAPPETSPENNRVD